jgi:hypothetical protein
LGNRTVTNSQRLDERTLFKTQRLRQPEQGRLVDRRKFCESAVAFPAEQPALLAMVVMPSAAIHAFAAVSETLQRDTIAKFETGDTFAEFCDDPCDFVSLGKLIVTGFPVAVVVVKVTAAYPGASGVDNHVAGRGRKIIHFADSDAFNTVVNGGFHFFHACLAMESHRVA